MYLPSFDEKYLIKRLNKIDTKWEMFSKHYKGKPYRDKNVTINPISNDLFVKSLTSCEGILCNSGFETPSEALFLGKKILAIPMKGQYEQECNAEALSKLGIKTINKIDKDFEVHIEQWINSDFIYHPDFKNNVPYIVDFILESNDTDYPDREMLKDIHTANGNHEYQDSLLISQ